MDLKVLFLSAHLYDFFMLVGIFSFCRLLLFIINNLLSLYYHKETYKSPKELRYFLLKEQNIELKKQLSQLQSENEEIVSSILNKLNKE